MNMPADRRRQERGLLRAIACAFLPHGHSHLIVERPKVAVDGPHVHPCAIGYLMSGEAVRVLKEKVGDAKQPRRPVALDEIAGQAA
jgi:hypothetical protein